MSRNPFGWDLPPGVTQRMIDDAAGGNDEDVMPDDVYELIDKLPVEEIERILAWATELRGTAYAEGYAAGQADEAMAAEYKQQKENPK
jgi:hypothetical protein